MEVKHTAIAGTVESSDLLVRVEPSQDGIELEIVSVVKDRFGHLIEAEVRGVLKALDVTNARVFVDDRGALDCVIRARVETALRRAAKEAAK